jgi:hypothetical protein
MSKSVGFTANKKLNKSFVILLSIKL